MRFVVFASRSRPGLYRYTVTGGPVHVTRSVPATGPRTVRLSGRTGLSVCGTGSVPWTYQVTGSPTGPRMSTSFCQTTSPGSTASRRSGSRSTSVVRSSSASSRASKGATQWWGP